MRGNTKGDDNGAPYSARRSRRMVSARQAQAGAGWTPGGQTFRVFQSPSASDTSFADACPVGATVSAGAPVSTSPYTYTLLYDLDAGDTTNYNYWVVAYAPAIPPGQIGAAGTPTPAIRQ